MSDLFGNHNVGFPTRRLNYYMIKPYRNCQNHYCPVYLHLTVIVLKFQADLQDKVLADDSLLEPVLLEVLRLYPPFLGGRRIVKKVTF